MLHHNSANPHTEAYVPNPRQKSIFSGAVPLNIMLLIAPIKPIVSYLAIFTGGCPLTLAKPPGFPYCFRT
jgi:hypothetical protein